MTETVLSTLTAALTAAGLDAVRAYPATALDRSRGPVVCVGIRENKLLSPGMGDYLGQRSDGGTVRELYGLRAECRISLDVFSPDDETHGAAGCVRCGEAIVSALGDLPAGLRLRSLRFGEAGYDRGSGMFRMTAELNCAAFLTRERDADTGVFTDFTLKGVLK